MRKYFYLLFVLLLAQTPTFAQLNCVLKGHLDYVDQLSNVWGYEQNGREYAIVGTYNGTSIVDVTDPTTPTELFFVDGANGIWREPKTWSHYAYISNETSGGLLIIDLANLPASITHSFWTGGTLPNGTTYTNNTTHDLFVDNNGYLYLTGSNQYNGLVILDLNANPTNPPIVGLYTGAYVHDGFARNDTAWVGQIYAGNFAVLDVSNKANPVVLATKSTPNNFTHNCWLTDEGDYLFTTDEKTGAYVAAYNVSNLSDIQETDRYRRSEGTGVIPHNTYVTKKNGTNFVVTSYYRDGFTAVDATYPTNIIETMHYDTSPLSGNGFNGAWGVYPYLPSGNILVSDMEEGLFVIEPHYTKACYLEGLITDATTGQAISGVTVTVMTTTQNATSNFGGNYQTGTALAGTYQVQFVKAGYATQTQTVTLVNGQLTTLNVSMSATPPYTANIQLLDAATNQPIPNAKVALNNAYYTNTLVTNASGVASFSLSYSGNYNIYAGGWGYITQLFSDQNLSNTNNTLTLLLNKGYYDDFLFDFGWTVQSTATGGAFERGVPVLATLTGQTTNPGTDAAGDYGNLCYITGAGGGMSNNLNDGTTTLTSPIFDLTTYQNPKLSFQRWVFFQNGSTDQMTITLSNGTTSVNLEQIFDGNVYEGSWALREFYVANYLTPTNQMRLTITIGDIGAANVVEGGFDFFKVEDAELPPIANFSANSTSGCTPFTTNMHSTSLNNVTAYLWLLPGSDIGTSTDMSPNPVYTTAGSYDVTLIVSNSVDTDTLEMLNFFTVYENPTVAPTASANTICAGSNVQLDANATGPSLTYQWFGSNLANNNVATVTATPESFSSYTVIVTSVDGCATQGSLSIDVNPSPQVEVSVNDADICAGQSITLSATQTVSPPQTLTYAWTGLGNSTQTGSSITATPTNAGTYNIQLSSTNSFGCTCVKTITVNINQNPTISNMTLPPTVCANAPFNLSAEVVGAEPFEYTWTGEGLTTSNTATVSTTPTLPVGIDEQTNNYTLLVTDANGCTTMQEAQTSVTLCSSVGWVEDENATFQISPNPNTGDFTVLLPNDNTSNLQLTIYNQLGQEVLLINHAATLQQGQELKYHTTTLPNGIYYVSLQTNGQQVVRKMVVER